MAIYEFECDNCGRTKELQRPMKVGAPAPYPCQVCMIGTMKRKFSPTAFKINHHKHRGGAEIVERARDIEQSKDPDVVNRYPTVANT